MFFKKKKDMSEMNTDKNNITNDDTDNLSQNESQNENLSTDQVEMDDEVVDSANGQSGDGEIEKLKAEIAELKDKNLRQIAEFENFRRRTAKERGELILTAAKDTIESLLVVLDDMDRAEKQLGTTTDIDIAREGVMLVFNKMRSVMQHKGVRKMEVVNEEFNPDLHEAITEIPAPSEEMKGKVLDVVESGYYLNDKLIRYAKVVVGN